MLLCVTLLLPACSFMSDSGGDSMARAYFRRGMRYREQHDAEKAIQAFEKALSYQNRFAPAHFQLGLLFEETKKDYPAAVYHYQRFVKNQPDHKDAPIAEASILRCLHEIGATVQLSNVSPKMKRDLLALTNERDRLRQETEELKRRVRELERSQPGASNGQTPGREEENAGSREESGDPPIRRATVVGPDQGGAGVSNQSGGPGRPAETSPAVRTHTIRQGENLYRLSKRYGVSLNSLRRANPGRDPRGLKVGDRINIPPR